MATWLIIVKTPRGEAPEHIRRAWVGVILPTVGLLGDGYTTPRGAITGNPTESTALEHWAVPQIEAIEALKEKQPEAATWWEDHGYPKPFGVFTFDPDEAVSTSDLN